jgi:rubrerythrin
MRDVDASEAGRSALDNPESLQIIKQMRNDNKTLAEIAETVGGSISAVHRLCDKYGFSLKRKVQRTDFGRRRYTSKRSPDVLVEHPIHIYRCKKCSISFVAAWVNRSHHFGIEVSHREPPRFCPYCGAPLKEKIRFETGGEHG